MRWDAAAYDGDFSFVTDYGAGLLELLKVEPPASVIDIGCGTGVHAAALADRGLDVVGVDLDPDMIARARESFPAVEFVVGNAQHLPTERLFDAALSNAALHWMPDQGTALASIRSVLKPGAPFVAEMGGKNNVEVVDAAIVDAVVALGLPAPHIRKFFPSLAQEAALLEGAGFEVTSMQWFERPTALASEPDSSRLDPALQGGCVVAGSCLSTRRVGSRNRCPMRRSAPCRGLVHRLLAVALRGAGGNGLIGRAQLVSD